MKAKRFRLALMLALCVLAPISAQDYQLGWDEVHTSSQKSSKTYTLGWQDVDLQVDRSEPQAIEYAPDAPVAAQPHIVDVAPPAPGADQAAPSGKVRKAKVPIYNIELAASQFYDVYAGKYKVVRALEVSTVRDGFSSCETFENRGAWTQYQVTMNDLKPGDQYKVRVIWEDGSNRTIEKTIGTYFTDRNVYVTQPDFLAYTAY